MQLTSKGKYKFCQILTLAICLRFIWNSYHYFKEDKDGLATTYLLIAIVLAVLSFVFLSRAKKTLLSIGIVFCLLPKPSSAQGVIKLGYSADSSKVKREYLDTIYLGLTKTAFIDVKGFDFLSGDLGSGNNGLIKLAVQENSHILKLHAVKPFAETNLFLTGEDTSVQFLIKFSPNPEKNYYGYSLPGLSSYYKRQIDSLTRLAAERRLVPADTAAAAPDNRTELEKKAATLMSPKNKLFSAVRSKNQNVTIGDIQRGVRIYLQKLYRSGNLTYFSVKIANFSMGEFQMDDFKIVKQESGQESDLNYINEESGFNLLKKYEKVDFIIIAEDIELSSTGKLIFTFSAKTNKEAKFKFEVTQKELNKRESL